MGREIVFDSKPVIEEMGRELMGVVDGGWVKMWNYLPSESAWRAMMVPSGG